MLKKFWEYSLNYIHYVKNHQILVNPHKRIYGIIYTLIGWFLIAFSLTVFTPESSKLPLSLSFLITFTTASLFLYIISRNGGISLKVSLMSDKDQKTHFDLSSRKILIFIRGFIAIISYVGLAVADKFIGIVSNSALFGSDALIYALLMCWILKEKRSSLDWLGILIATVGVTIPFVVNSFSSSILNAVSGGLIGLAASVFMSIIFFLNAVIVRHEPATRVAFYQCLIGTGIAILISICTLSFILKTLPSISLSSILSSIWMGIAYALALICFFRAFLYTEIILIAISGYAFDPMAALLNNFFGGAVCSLTNGITIALITIGTAILYYEESRHSKKRKHLKMTQPIYESTIAEEFEENDQLFQKGQISTDTYLAKRKLFNELLFKISEEMIDTDVKKIELEKGQVYFSFFDSDLKLECDEDLQATPLDILNFGSYWKEELAFIFDLCTSESTILDFSAQVGWLSLNLAKKFPKATLYSFEANTDPYSHLQRNIKTNACSNVEPINIRLSNREGIENFFLLPEDHILTPQKNALIYSEISKIECKLTTLDAFVSHKELKSLDLIAGHAIGGELEILQGAEKAIDQFHPIIFFELFEDFCLEYDYSISDLVHFLQEKGYQGYHLKLMTHQKKSENEKEEEANPYYFFFHKEKHQELLSRFQERIYEIEPDDELDLH